MLENRGLPITKSLAVALTLVMTFEVAGIPLAQASQTQIFWQNRQAQLNKTNISDLPKPAFIPSFSESSFKSDELEIPHNVAQVVESWSPQSPSAYPRVIHIQDVHNDLQVQINIARVLEHLLTFSPDKPLVVGVEGAWTPLDFTPYNNTAYDDWREMTARAFLQENYISGAHYFALTHKPQAVTLVGVENRDEYLKNLIAREGSEQDRKRMVDALEFLGRRMERLERFLLPSSIRELEQSRRRYLRGEISEADYVRYLLKFNPDGKSFPEVGRYLEALALEKRINLGALNAAREKLLRQIVATGNEVEMEKLLQLSIAFKESRINSLGYHERLMAAASRTNLTVPYELKKFADYLLSFQKISADKMMSEIAVLEKLARQKLSARAMRYADIRTFLLLADKLDEQRKLWSLELTPQSVAEVIRTGDSLDWVGAEKFLFTMEKNLGLKPYPRVVQPDYKKALPFVKDFYGLALNRDSTMVGKLLTHLEKNTLKASPANFVLVTGGFHTPGLTRELREKNIPYIVLQPALKVKDITDNKVSLTGRLPNPWDLIGGELISRLGQKSRNLVPLLSLSVPQKGGDPVVVGSLRAVAQVANGQLSRVTAGPVQVQKSGSAIRINVKADKSTSVEDKLKKSREHKAWQIFAAGVATGVVGVILLYFAVTLAPVVFAALPLEVFTNNWRIIVGVAVGVVAGTAVLAWLIVYFKRLKNRDPHAFSKSLVDYRNQLDAGEIQSLAASRWERIRPTVFKIVFTTAATIVLIFITFVGQLFAGEDVFGTNGGSGRIFQMGTFVFLSIALTYGASVYLEGKRKSGEEDGSVSFLRAFVPPPTPRSEVISAVVTQTNRMPPREPLRLTGPEGTASKVVIPAEAGIHGTHLPTEDVDSRLRHSGMTSMPEVPKSDVSQPNEPSSESAPRAPEAWDSSKGIPDLEGLKQIQRETRIKIPSIHRIDIKGRRLRQLGLRAGFLYVMGVTGSEVNRVYERDGGWLHGKDLADLLKENSDENGRLIGGKVRGYMNRHGISRVKGYAVDWAPLVAIIIGGWRDPERKEKVLEALLWLETQDSALGKEAGEFWILTENIFGEVDSSLKDAYEAYKKAHAQPVEEPATAEPINDSKPDQAQIEAAEVETAAKVEAAAEAKPAAEVNLPAVGSEEPSFAKSLVAALQLPKVLMLPAPSKEKEKASTPASAANDIRMPEFNDIDAALVGAGVDPDSSLSPPTVVPSFRSKAPKPSSRGFLRWLMEKPSGTQSTVSSWLVLVLALLLPLLIIFKGRLNNASSYEGTKPPAAAAVVDHGPKNKPAAPALAVPEKKEKPGQPAPKTQVIKGLKAVFQPKLTEVTQRVQGTVGVLSGMGKKVVEEGRAQVETLTRQLEEQRAQSQVQASAKADKELAKAESDARARRNYTIASRIVTPSQRDWVYFGPPADFGVEMRAPIGMQEAYNRGLTRDKFKLRDADGKVIETWWYRFRNRFEFEDYIARNGTFPLDRVNGQAGPWAARSLAWISLEEEGVVFRHDGVVSRSTGYKPDLNTLLKKGPQNWRFQVLDTLNDCKPVAQFFDEASGAEWANKQQLNGNVFTTPFDKETGFIHPLTEDGRYVVVPFGLAVTFDPERDNEITSILQIPPYDPSKTVQPVNIWSLRLEWSDVYPYIPSEFRVPKGPVFWSRLKPANPWTKFLSTVHFMVPLEREDRLIGRAGDNRVIVDVNGVKYALVKYFDTQDRNAADLRLLDPTKKNKVGDRVLLTLTDIPLMGVIRGEGEVGPSSVIYFSQYPWMYYFNTLDGMDRVINPFLEALHGLEAGGKDLTKGMMEMRMQARSDAQSVDDLARALDNITVQESRMNQRIRTDYLRKFREITELGRKVELGQSTGSNLERIWVQISNQLALMNPERGMVWSSEIPTLGDRKFSESDPAMIRLQLPYEVNFNDPYLQMCRERIKETDDPAVKRQWESNFAVRVWLNTLEAAELHKLEMLEKMQFPGLDVNTRRLQINTAVEIIKKAKDNNGVIGRRQVAAATVELTKLLGIDLLSIVPSLGSEEEAMEDLLVRDQRRIHGFPRSDISHLQKAIPFYLSDPSKAESKRGILKMVLENYVVEEMRAYYTDRFKRRVQIALEILAGHSIAHPNETDRNLLKEQKDMLISAKTDTLTKFEDAQVRMNEAIDKAIDSLMKGLPRVPTAADVAKIIDQIMEESNFDATGLSKSQLDRLDDAISPKILSLKGLKGELNEQQKKAVALYDQIKFAEINQFDSVVPFVYADLAIFLQIDEFLRKLDVEIASTQDDNLRDQLRAQHQKYVKDGTGKGKWGGNIGKMYSQRVVERKYELAKQKSGTQNYTPKKISQHRVQNRNGGSWFLNSTYWRLAFLETPLVYLVSFGLVQLAIQCGLGIFLAGLLWFAAPYLFFQGHRWLGNPQGVYSSDVRKLTLAKGLVSTLGFAFTLTGFGELESIIFGGLILSVTLWHMAIQLTTSPPVSSFRNDQRIQKVNRMVAERVPVQSHSVRVPGRSPRLISRRGFLQRTLLAGAVLAGLPIFSQAQAAEAEMSAPSPQMAKNYQLASDALLAMEEGMIGRAMLEPFIPGIFKSPHEDLGFTLFDWNSLSTTNLPNRWAVEDYFKGMSLWEQIDSANWVYEIGTLVNGKGIEFCANTGFRAFKPGPKYKYFVLDLKNGEIVERFFNDDDLVGWTRKNLDKDLEKGNILPDGLYRRLSKHLVVAKFAMQVTFDPKTGRLTGAYDEPVDIAKWKVRPFFKYGPIPEERITKIKASASEHLQIRELGGTLRVYLMGQLWRVIVKEKDGQYYSYDFESDRPDVQVLGMRNVDREEKLGDIVMITPVFSSSARSIHPMETVGQNSQTAEVFHDGYAVIRETPVFKELFGKLDSPGVFYKRMEMSVSLGEIDEELSRRFSGVPSSEFGRQSYEAAKIGLRWLSHIEPRIVARLKEAQAKGDLTAVSTYQKHLQMIETARNNWAFSSSGIPILVFGDIGFKLANAAYRDLNLKFRELNQKKDTGKIFPEENILLERLSRAQESLKFAMRRANDPGVRIYLRDSAPRAYKYDEAIDENRKYLGRLSIEIADLRGRDDSEKTRSEVKTLIDRHSVAGTELHWNEKEAFFAINPGYGEAERNFSAVKEATGIKDWRDKLPDDDHITGLPGRTSSGLNLKPKGGSWSTHLLYFANRAYLETPKVFLGALVLAVLTGSPLAWFLAPAYFWLRHIPQNKAALFSGDVIFLTGGKTLVALLGLVLSLQGFAWPAVILVMAPWIAALTILHRAIQKKKLPDLLKERLGALHQENGPTFEAQKIVDPAAIREGDLIDASEVASTLPQPSPSPSKRALAALKDFLGAWLGSRINNDPVDHVIQVNSVDELKNIIRSIQAINTMRAGRGDDLRGTKYVLVATADLAPEVRTWIDDASLPASIRKNLAVLDLPENAEGLAGFLVGKLSERPVSLEQVPDRTFNMLFNGNLAEIVKASRPRMWEKKVLVNTIDWNGPDGELALAKALISFYFSNAEARGILKILHDYGSMLNFQSDVFALIAKMA